MSVIVASDLHGSIGACRALLKQVECLSPDVLVLLGDLLYHGPRNLLPADYAPQEVVEALNAVGGRILAVRGNCDAEVDQMLCRFPMMADSAMMLLDGQRCLMSHGHLYSPERLPPHCPGDVLLFGHTHLPMNTQRDGLLLLNPGSTTFPKGGHAPTFLLWDGAWSHRTLDGALYFL